MTIRSVLVAYKIVNLFVIDGSQVPSYLVWQCIASNEHDIIDSLINLNNRMRLYRKSLHICLYIGG
jgi:hypothetical protein